MRKTWILPCLFAVAVLGCERTPSEPAAPAGDTQQVPDRTEVAATETVTPAPVRRQAGALKSELPEGFVLPFPFHRLYDNTTSKAGKAQRRVMVEYLDQEAAAVQSALTDALAAKGFSAPATSKQGEAVSLDFSRADGARVEAKIQPGRNKARVPNAKGTVHFVWTAGE